MVIDIAKEKKKQSYSIIPAQCLESAKPAAKSPGQPKESPPVQEGEEIENGYGC